MDINITSTPLPTPAPAPKAKKTWYKRKAVIISAVFVVVVGSAVAIALGTKAAAVDPDIAAVDAEWASLHTDCDSGVIGYTAEEMPDWYDRAINTVWHNSSAADLPRTAATEAHVRQLVEACFKLAETPATTEASSSGVTLSDFSLSLITLEDECFDSAGGLVTVETDVAIAGGEYPGRATLIYEIHGGESVETHSIEIDGDRYDTDKNSISTASCNAKLTAVPVRLIER